MAAICGRILERSPTFRTHFHVQKLGDLGEGAWGGGALTSPKRQTKHTETLLPALLALRAGSGRRTCNAPDPLGDGGARAPWGRPSGKAGRVCPVHPLGTPSLPPSSYDTGSEATPSPAHPHPAPFHCVISTLTWPLRTTWVFSSSPFLVSSKIIKPNPTCVACLCQGRWERPRWRGGWNAARDSGDGAA